MRGPNVPPYRSETRAPDQEEMTVPQRNSAPLRCAGTPTRPRSMRKGRSAAQPRDAEFRRADLGPFLWISARDSPQGRRVPCLCTAPLGRDPPARDAAVPRFWRRNYRPVPSPLPYCVFFFFSGTFARRPVVTRGDARQTSPRKKIHNMRERDGEISLADPRRGVLSHRRIRKFNALNSK